MGSASSSGVDIILTNPILSDLENGTDLALGQVNSLYLELIDHSSNSAYIEPAIFGELLGVMIRSPSTIVEAFTHTNKSGEKLVSVKCVICALIIYSNAPWVSKVRFIYSMFEKKKSQALGLEEMSKLAKTVIKSVYIMTGMKLPPVSLVRDITSKAFIRADTKRRKRVGIDEFLAYIKLEAEFMSLLKYFHPKIVFETGNEAPTVKIFHSRNSSLVPPSVIAEEERSIIFTRRNRPTYTQIYSKNSPETEAISKLPEIKTPKSRKQDLVKEAVIAGVYRSMGVFNGTIKEKGKFYAELLKYLLDHGYIKPITFYQKRWSSRNLTLEEAITVLKPHFDSILVKSESQLTLSQQKMQSEYKRFSTIVPVGESGDNGWEHSDIYEVKGENGVESYYCIKQNPRRLPKLRNKSTDFLCVSFDEYLQIKNKSDNDSFKF